VAHRFPDITAYGSALRFALEAEQACADLAAAAGVLAPDQAWRDKLEEVVCTHDDRVQKLNVLPIVAGPAAQQPVHALEGSAYLGTLDAEPVTTWPGAVEQLCQAEEDTARYHDAFAAECRAILGDRAKSFEKSAKQDRDYAAELRRLLG
jgi:hypothetical protein